MTDKEYRKKYYQENRERFTHCQRDYYQNNREKSIKYSIQWNKDNKEKKKEYDKKRYQKNRERSIKQSIEWRKNNQEKYDETAKKHRNSEKGFLQALWQDIKRKPHSFKDFDDFYNHWLEQKKIYGMTCPATGVEMTMKALFNEKGKRHRCGTNLSKDRILSSREYNHQNLIFTCWDYNKAKNAMTPKMAKTYLKIVKERYGTDEME